MANTLDPTRSTRSLLDEYRVDPYSTQLFDTPEPDRKKKVFLAVGLLLFGSALIIAGANVYLHNQKGGIPLLVVGSLAFLPGFYFSRIAYYAYKGKQGFNLNLIPDM